MFKKIKGHYAERMANKERTVISYEDVPLDDYEQEKTEMSVTAVKKIIFGVAGVLLLTLIVFAFANREKLTWDNISMWWHYEVLGTAGQGYPVNIVGSEAEQGNFSVHQGRVAYASDTSFVTLNNTGREVCNLQLRYTKPVMKSKENRYFLFGLGEKDYQIASFDSKLYSGTADGGILAADIAANGKYCYVIEGNGYYSQLYAFDANNNRMFKYSFAEYYINSVTINSSGTGCVACGISNSEGEIKTCVYVLDFARDEPLAKHEIEGDYIIDSKYLSGARAALVGGNASYVVLTDGDELRRIDYEGKPLANYCFCPESGTFSLALSKSGDGRSCDLITYNDGGDLIYSADTSFSSESLSSFRGVTATLDGNMVYVFNSDGSQRYSCYAGTGSERIILTSESEAYVLSVNQIRKLDLTHQSSPDSAY